MTQLVGTSPAIVVRPGVLARCAGGPGGSEAAADFYGSPVTGGAPLTVSFHDTSSGSPSTWAWDFGDGSTSTLQNPIHTYTGAGTFTVSLTATTSSGLKTKTRTGYITVGAVPFAGLPTCLYDPFNRTVSANTGFTAWGQSPIQGQFWGPSGGTMSVNGSQAIIAGGGNHLSDLVVAGGTLPFEVVAEAVGFGTGAGTIPFEMEIDNNPFTTSCFWEVDSTASTDVSVSCFGDSTSAFGTVGGIAGNPFYVRMRIETDGSVRMKVWPTSGSEPGSWAIDAGPDSVIASVMNGSLTMSVGGYHPTDDWIMNGIGISAGASAFTYSVAWDSPYTFDDWNRTNGPNAWGAASGGGTWTNHTSTSGGSATFTQSYAVSPTSASYSITETSNTVNAFAESWNDSVIASGGFFHRSAMQVECIIDINTFYNGNGVDGIYYDDSLGIGINHGGGGLGITDGWFLLLEATGAFGGPSDQPPVLMFGKTGSVSGGNLTVTAADLGGPITAGHSYHVKIQVAQDYYAGIKVWDTLNSEPADYTRMAGLGFGDATLDTLTLRVGVGKGQTTACHFNAITITPGTVSQVAC